MSRPDALLMLADIARLAFEHSDVDETLIRAIYQHQVLTTGRQPTLRQAREYIGHLTSHLDDATIRVTLGLPPLSHCPRDARRAQPCGRAGPAGVARGAGPATVATRAAYRQSAPSTYPATPTSTSWLDGSSVARPPPSAS